MRRVILESPYAGKKSEIEANVIYARRCVRDCLGRGESPIASHLLFTQEGILNDEEPEQRKLGIEAGLAWILSAEAMVLYVDRGMSRGMNEAMKLAQRLGVPTELRSLDVVEMGAS